MGRLNEETRGDLGSAVSRRATQFVLIASTLGLSWLGMQVVHESGHVACARLAGERVERVVLHPLAISRTDASHMKHPLLVAWGGPVAGVTLPLAMLGIARLARWRLWYLVQFFAGFCLVANGAYLGVGAIDGVGDAGDLLRFGAHRAALIAFGLVGLPAGLFLWHGLGPHFGLGAAAGAVDRRAAWGMLITLGVVVATECLLSPRR